MATHACESCRMRARYERKPNSFLGRLWRWHTRWCPGWKAYLASLTEEDKGRLLESLHLHKS
jgi:hypothetical protein